MKKLYSVFLGVVIVVLLFPIYSLMSVDEVYTNEWFDVIIGNVIFALVLIWGGRYALIFGGLVAFQRILEIMVVHIWANGRFSTGITRQLFLNMQTSTFTENFGYFKQIYPLIFLSFIVFGIYLFIYYYACKQILKNRKKYSTIIYKIYSLLKMILVVYLIYFAWNKKVRTDIFFFENNKDQQLTWLNMENKYPFLTTPIDKKIDVYFVLGESVTATHLSIYGYNRPTTPYLSTLNNLTVYNNAISPAPSTFNSYEIMFSRINGSNLKTFFTSPNMIEELKNMGYHTLWQTYYPLRKSLVFEALANSVDVFLSSDIVGNDLAMLPMLKQNLNTKPAFYIVNMFGSHPFYDVPKPQKHFSKTPNQNNKQDTINRYDDTVLALDNFLKQIHIIAQNHKQQTGRDFVIWYVSDHGQSIYSANPNWVGHAINQDDIQGYNVPMLIFNKDKLPCKNKLPNPNMKKIKTGKTFDFVLTSLCGIK